MKKSTLVVSLFAVILVLLFCCIIMSLILLADLKEINTSNDSNYGKWNEFTVTTLDEFSASLLPDKALIPQWCRCYHYGYHQALLGDPNFYIYADLRPDGATFNSEVQRLKDLGSSVQVNGEQFIIVNGTKDAFADYCDEATYDGMNFFFELARIDSANNRIQYLTAFIWDYHHEHLVSEFIYPLVG